ncbi:MAG TPA: cupredoxin domain-containing protein [Vicinamibacterales bacterium]|nr:cupredoxin domain-containing protein [Vicinamibacterales bacterium]
MTILSGFRSRAGFFAICGVLVGIVAGGVLLAQAQREFNVSARKYAFTVSGTDTAEIRVNQDDNVAITFTAEDIAHSFTIDDDHYRISRRAEPGKPAQFRFRADKPGEFAITCSLQIDEKCRGMRARLVVTAKTR